MKTKLMVLTVLIIAAFTFARPSADYRDGFSRQGQYRQETKPRFNQPSRYPANPMWKQPFSPMQRQMFQRHQSRRGFGFGMQQMPMHRPPFMYRGQQGRFGYPRMQQQGDFRSPNAERFTPRMYAPDRDGRKGFGMQQMPMHRPPFLNRGQEGRFSYPRMQQQRDFRGSNTERFTPRMYAPDRDGRKGFQSPKPMADKDKKACAVKPEPNCDKDQCPMQNKDGQMRRYQRMQQSEAKEPAEALNKSQRKPQRDINEEKPKAQQASPQQLKLMLRDSIYEKDYDKAERIIRRLRDIDK